MKPDEAIFFSYCYFLRTRYHWHVRDVVACFEGLIHHKRIRYLLEKWSDLGFYNYGVSLDLGWFEDDKLPDRYRNIVDIFSSCYVEGVMNNE